MTTEATVIDHLVPEAATWWRSLERHCVAACCGFDAFDFSRESVVRAGGALLGDERRALVDALRRGARTVRTLPAGRPVLLTHLGEAHPPATYADLLAELADHLGQVGQVGQVGHRGPEWPGPADVG